MGQGYTPRSLRYSASVVVLALLATVLLYDEPVRMLEAPLPRRVHVDPVYPEAARREEREDIIDVIVTVAPDGTVVEAKSTGGYVDLVAAAEAAVARWVFAKDASAPGLRRFQVSVPFRIPEKRVHHLPPRELTVQLMSDDPSAAWDAHVELIERGVPMMSFLIPLLRSEDARQRQEAADVVAGIGAPARVAVPTLAAEIGAARNRGEAADVLQHVVAALASVDMKALRIVLEKAISRGDEQGCCAMVREMSDGWHREFQSDDVRARALELPGCRLATLRALQRAEPPPPPAVLRPLLRDDDAKVRRAALEVVLGRTGMGRRERFTHDLVPDLGRLLDDPLVETRRMAVDGLRWATPAEVVVWLPALIRRLEDEDPSVLVPAADVIRTLGPAARPAGPALLAAMKRTTGSLQQSLAAAALAVEAGKTDAQLEQEPLLREMAAREWCGRKPGTAYLTFKGADVPSDVRERLRAAGCAVESGSAAPRGEAFEGLREGYRVDIDHISWEAGDLVHVSLKAWCGPLCAEGGYVVLTLQDGKWTVLRLVITVVS
jgi:HEAT repeat protein